MYYRRRYQPTVKADPKKIAVNISERMKSGEARATPWMLL
jgi:hypothetical protein